MAGEALYERYKDALRRGHVAALRGRLDEALDAYVEAASIAPDRPTPHTSAGTALLRRGKAADALRRYDAALRIAPRDEAALLGRARALVALGHRSEAADAYDAVAEVREAAGKLGDAVEAARQGLELAEGRMRRRLLERLIGELRATEPDQPGRDALDRALLVLDGPAMESPPAAAAVVEPGEGQEGAGGEAAAPEPVEPEAPPVPAPPARPTSGLDVAALSAAAEAALESGDRATALDRLLDLAAVHRRERRIDAALDACYLALSAAPDDGELHLALVSLYDERGWDALTAEKLDLLGKLAELDANDEVAAWVGGARSGRA